MLETTAVILGTTIGLIAVMQFNFHRVKVRTQKYLLEQRNRK